MVTLQNLEERPIWVAWQAELDEAGNRQIKMPYAPGGGKAKSNNPRSWGTRSHAAQRKDALPNPFGAHGVGLVLTALEEGLHLGGVDLDACRDPNTRELAAWAEEIVDRFASYTEVSPSNTGVKIFFVYDVAILGELREQTNIKNACTARRKGDGPKDPGIELYVAERYFTVTDQQQSLTAELRQVPLEDLLWLVRIAIPKFKGKPERTQPAPARGPLTLEDVESAFEVIKNADLSWDEWNAIGMKLYAATSGSEKGLEIFDKWSRKSTKYDAEATRGRWEHFHRSPPDQVGGGSIIYLAKQSDPKWISPSEQRSERVPLASDEGMAALYALRHKDDLRYTAKFGHWNHWTGQHWQRDDTLLHMDLSRRLCKEIAIKMMANRASIASAKKVGAVITLARADRTLAATTEQWDRDPWLLATPGGTVDLRTGALRPADPTDYITRLTATAPGGECPMWHMAISQICKDDPERVAYLQRVAGYMLTGLTREEKIFFLYGGGRNGKGTFVETLSKILKDYATSVGMNTLIMTKHQEHPTEIAKLKGVRLATASETVDGARWNMARIKLLTGGDGLTGRFMRGDYFDFPPSHKLVVSSNHKPALGTVDKAIEARMELIPFEVSFAAAPDLKLKERLAKEEAGGILAWAIEGCLAWQRVGLATPADVAAATRTYLNEQDDIEVFLGDSCTSASPSHKIAVPQLYVMMQEWTQRNGAYLPSKKEFTERLKGRGYAIERGTGNIAYLHGFTIGAPGEPAASYPKEDEDIPF